MGLVYYKVHHYLNVSEMIKGDEDSSLAVITLNSEILGVRTVAKKKSFACAYDLLDRFHCCVRLRLKQEWE